MFLSRKGQNLRFTGKDLAVFSRKSSCVAGQHQEPSSDVFCRSARRKLSVLSPDLLSTNKRRVCYTARETMLRKQNTYMLMNG